MKFAQLWPFGCLLLLLVTQRAPAQAFIPVQEAGQGGFVSLAPTTGSLGTPVFLNADGTLPRGINIEGSVGGSGAANVGEISIGFDYLRPYWTSHDFMLAVPAANVSSFPLLGNIGSVDNHFAFSPIVKYKYDVQDIGLAFNASGTFLSLTGDLNRTITDANGGTGTLTASSSLTIVTANLPEISGRLYYDKLVENHPNLNWSCFDGLVIDIGFGTRYTSLQQSYTGNLTNTDASGASNTSARASTQSFKGLGFTSSLDFSLPIRQNWVMFTNLRGSVVVGENTETSSLNVNITGATPISNILTQTRTQFVPIGNIEVGTQCGFELGQSLRDGTRPPFVTLRLAVTGQVWGGVGPLSAGSPQGYTTNNLFLVGAHIMVVLNR